MGIHFGWSITYKAAESSKDQWRILLHYYTYIHQFPGDADSYYSMQRDLNHCKEQKKKKKKEGNGSIWTIRKGISVEHGGVGLLPPPLSSLQQFILEDLVGVSMHATLHQTLVSFWVRQVLCSLFVIHMNHRFQSHSLLHSNYVFHDFSILSWFCINYIYPINIIYIKENILLMHKHKWSYKY